jgi:putative transposase
MGMAIELAPQVGVTGGCRAANVSRATYYRNLPTTSSMEPSSRGENNLEEEAEVPTPVEEQTSFTRSHRALGENEEGQVLEELHSKRFRDKSPGEVYATLLDEGTYLCSERTMYRILGKHDEVKERRNQRKHPNYKKPELLATKPNQVWSWDITKLKGPVKWTYFYLYVILDIFSRYVVGWLVAPRENAMLAQQLIAETVLKQKVGPGELSIHSDRGSPMKAKGTALLMADLGITKSHSRPHVSDDNPFSESQFKTLKYCSEFPARFGSVMDARAFCVPFFDWYNREHRHTGIGMMTPEMVHYGQAQQVRQERQRVLQAAYAAHPERFVRGRPTPPTLPEAVWINPPVVSHFAPLCAANDSTDVADDTVEVLA